MSITKRLERIIKIPKEYLTETPPVPKSVKIELSPRCNYNCIYCGYSQRRDKREKDMDLGLFKRITTEMKILGVEEIGVFYIGESFINPKLLVNAIWWLKKELKIPYVFLTSNASLADHAIVRHCMEAGLDSLKWSCNVYDEKQFEKMIGVSSFWFNKAKENIKEAYAIRGSDYSTKLYASSIRYSEEQVEKMQPFLKEFILPYVDEHYWLPLYTMGGLTKEKEQKLGLNPVLGNPGPCNNSVDFLPCWTVFTAGHILSDGRVSACCMDATGNWVMGDLTKQSFMECWYSEEFKKLRRAHLEKNVISTKCVKCVLMGDM